MTKEQFIKEIAKYVQKYAPQYNIKVNSPVIAQAILESGAGTSELAINANNFFGLKYKAGRCPTACGVYYKVGSEQNPDGSYTSSSMQWCKFNNMEDCVIGYFDFINNSKYANLKGVTNPETYLINIRADGYATSLKYVENLMRVINDYELLQYDKQEEKPVGKNSSLISYIKLSPNCNKPRNAKIKKITIHHMAGNLTVERCGDLFADPSRKASSNYAIGTDGRIAMYVEEANRAWTSSNAGNDNQAITIEVANDQIGGNWHVSDKAMESLINLCVDICKRNPGIGYLNFTGNKNGNLTMHKYFAATACPGPYLESKFPWIAEEVNKRLGKKTEDSLAAADTYTVQSGDTLSKIGQKTGIAWKTIAQINNIKFPYIIKKGQVLKLKETTKASYIINKLDYAPVFDPTFYSNNYPDLKAAFGTDATKLFNHFKQYGMKERRQAHTNFNPILYKNRYTDLSKAFGDNWAKYYEHYIVYGIKENRKAN